MSRMSFEYVALDRTGVRLRGVAEAANQAEAYHKVSASGLTPLSIRPVRERLRSRRARVRSKDIAHFTYQFSVLLSARIPISEGLMSIAVQENNLTLRLILKDVAARIESGQQIAEAMGHHVKVFGEMYVETVRAAERTGNLTSVLEHLSEMLERQQETNQQIKSALMYPACVLVVLTLAVTFLIGFVIPKFAKMFTQRGVSLPFFTRLLMNLGESVQDYWWGYLIALGAALLAIRALWRRPASRRVIENGLHRVPGLGAILTGVAVSRFMRVFGLSVRSGVGLIDALDLSAKTTGRPRLIEDARRMVEQVRGGGRLKDVLVLCTYLPPFARRMLAAGEDSAELPGMCSLVARHYEHETSYLTKNLTTIIEPVMVVAIAGVVLVVALAIFLPMWDMVKLVS